MRPFAAASTLALSRRVCDRARFATPIKASVCAATQTSRSACFRSVTSFILPTRRMGRRDENRRRFVRAPRPNAPHMRRTGVERC